MGIIFSFYLENVLARLNLLCDTPVKKLMILRLLVMFSPVAAVWYGKLKLYKLGTNCNVDKNNNELRAVMLHAQKPLPKMRH